MSTVVTTNQKTIDFVTNDICSKLDCLQLIKIFTAVPTKQGQYEVVQELKSHLVYIIDVVNNFKSKNPILRDEKMRKSIYNSVIQCHFGQLNANDCGYTYEDFANFKTALEKKNYNYLSKAKNLLDMLKTLVRPINESTFNRFMEKNMMLYDAMVNRIAEVERAANARQNKQFSYNNIPQANNDSKKNVVAKKPSNKGTRKNNGKVIVNFNTGKVTVKPQSKNKSSANQRTQAANQPNQVINRQPPSPVNQQNPAVNRQVPQPAGIQNASLTVTPVAPKPVVIPEITISTEDVKKVGEIVERELAEVLRRNTHEINNDDDFVDHIENKVIGDVYLFVVWLLTKPTAAPPSNPKRRQLNIPSNNQVELLIQSAAEHFLINYSLNTALKYESSMYNDTTPVSDNIKLIRGLMTKYLKPNLNNKTSNVVANGIFKQIFRKLFQIHAEEDVVVPKVFDSHEKTTKVFDSHEKTTFTEWNKYFKENAEHSKQILYYTDPRILNPALFDDKILLHSKLPGYIDFVIASFENAKESEKLNSVYKELGLNDKTIQMVLMMTPESRAMFLKMIGLPKLNDELIEQETARAKILLHNLITDGNNAKNDIEIDNGNVKNTITDIKYSNVNIWNTLMNRGWNTLMNSDIVYDKTEIVINDEVYDYFTNLKDNKGEDIQTKLLKLETLLTELPGKYTVMQKCVELIQNTLLKDQITITDQMNAIQDILSNKDVSNKLGYYQTGTGKCIQQLKTVNFANAFDDIKTLAYEIDALMSETQSLQKPKKNAFIKSQVPIQMTPHLLLVLNQFKIRFNYFIIRFFNAPDPSCKYKEMINSNAQFDPKTECKAEEFVNNSDILEFIENGLMNAKLYPLGQKGGNFNVVANKVFEAIRKFELAANTFKTIVDKYNNTYTHANDTEIEAGYKTYKESVNAFIDELTNNKNQGIEFRDVNNSLEPTINYGTDNKTNKITSQIEDSVKYSLTKLSNNIKIALDLINTLKSTIKTNIKADAIAVAANNVATGSIGLGVANVGFNTGYNEGVKNGAEQSNNISATSNNSDANKTQSQIALGSKPNASQTVHPDSENVLKTTHNSALHNMIPLNRSLSRQSSFDLSPQSSFDLSRQSSINEVNKDTTTQPFKLTKDVADEILAVVKTKVPENSPDPNFNNFRYDLMKSVVIYSNDLLKGGKLLRGNRPHRRSLKRRTKFTKKSKMVQRPSKKQLHRRKRTTAKKLGERSS